MTIETDVVKGIIGAAVSAIGGTYPIQAPGRVFEKPNDGRYYELILIEDDNGNETWGDEQLFSGDIRIILHWPLDDRGIYEPVRVVSELKAIFPKGRIIWNGDARLLISETPRIKSGIEDKLDMLYPMVVTYQYFHNP